MFWLEYEYPLLQSVHNTTVNDTENQHNAGDQVFASNGLFLPFVPKSHIDQSLGTSTTAQDDVTVIITSTLDEIFNKVASHSAVKDCLVDAHTTVYNNKCSVHPPTPTSPPHLHLSQRKLRP